jgi:hypothetical protein
LTKGVVLFLNIKMNNKFKFLYRNAHWILASIGVALPFIVLGYTGFKIRKLDRGVEKDIERIQKKGKKFSDIPKSI